MMQVVLWPAAPHARFSRSRPISIPLSAATFEISLMSVPSKSLAPSEYPVFRPSSNARRQTIPSAESGGDSFARPARRSIETSSVMGLYINGDEAGTGGDANGGVGSGTGAGDVAGGAEISAGDVGWLLGGKTGAGSCFLPFLAMRVEWEA